MSNHKVRKNLLVGAAIAAGILGTVSSLLRNNKKDKENSFAREKEHINKKMIIGGMAGGVVAAATALLLAPKSGKELIKEIYGPFSKFFKEARAKVLPKTDIGVQKKRPARLKAKSLVNREKALSQKGKEALLITKKKVLAKAASKKKRILP